MFLYSSVGPTSGACGGALVCECTQAAAAFVNWLLWRMLVPSHACCLSVKLSPLSLGIVWATTYENVCSERVISCPNNSMESITLDLVMLLKLDALKDYVAKTRCLKNTVSRVPHLANTRAWYTILSQYEYFLSCRLYLPNMEWLHNT